MGLDMYAYEVSSDMIIDDFNYDKDKFTQPYMIQQWRKNRHLHNWMEELYYKKGGLAESFNCVNIRLSLEDLDALENSIVEDNLPSKGGFFFGNNEYTDVYKEEDLEFIKHARELISDGSAIYYTSWW